MLVDWDGWIDQADELENGHWKCRPPDVLLNFNRGERASAAGARWRVADLTAHVVGTRPTPCTVDLVHPPGMTTLST